MSTRMKLLTPGHIALLALVALLLLVAPHLVGQADSTGTGGSGGGIDLLFVLKGITAIVIPGASTYLWSLFKKGVDFLDQLDTIPQQIAAFLFGVLISWLAGFTSVVLPADYHLWSGDVLQNLLTGLATLGFHAIRKSK